MAEPFTKDELDEVRRYDYGVTVTRLIATIDHNLEVYEQARDAYQQAIRELVRPEPIDFDLAVSMLAEGIHTGLRKGTDASGADAAWRAIAAPRSGWEDAVRFAVDGLDFMGFVIVKKEV